MCTKATIFPFGFSYVDRKKVLGGDEAAYEYRWGSRAERELSKRQVLQFVSEVLHTYTENTLDNLTVFACRAKPFHFVVLGLSNF